MAEQGAYPMNHQRPSETTIHNEYEELFNYAQHTGHCADMVDRLSNDRRDK